MTQAKLGWPEAYKAIQKKLDALTTENNKLKAELLSWNVCAQRASDAWNRRMDEKEQEFVSFTEHHEVQTREMQCRILADDKEIARLTEMVKDLEPHIEIGESLMKEVKRLDNEIEQAEARLTFRGKVTTGVFCDGCASWEQMAWEAEQELATLRKVVDMLKDGPGGWWLSIPDAKAANLDIEALKKEMK